MHGGTHLQTFNEQLEIQNSGLVSGLQKGLKLCLKQEEKVSIRLAACGTDGMM